jgi:pimeloyl-ACP methyl ester carboxylesterase
MRGYRASFVLGSLFLSALTGLCQACGAPRPSDQEAAPSAQPRAVDTPVVIVMGGFSSCGQDPQTLAYSPHIRADYAFGLLDYHEPVQSALSVAHATPRFVLSCYTFGVNFPTTPGEQEPLQNQIIFDTNLAGLEPRLSQPHELLPFKALAPYRTTTIDDLFDQLVSTLGTIPSPRIALVGQSYGGWSVIKLADRLLAAGYSVPYLLTIDPISMRECTPAVAASAVYNSVQHRACGHAPEDLDAEIARVANGVGSWTNYWQDQAKWLHSSPIEDGAGKIRNVWLDYRQMNSDSLAAHAFSTYDPAVVEPESQQLVKALTD